MKKIMAMLLAMVMLLSFAGCGGNPAYNADEPVDYVEVEMGYTHEDFIGTWVNIYDVLDTITFTDDSKGKFYEQINESSSSHSDFDWSYEDGFIILHLNNSYTFEIVEENGERFIIEQESEYYDKLFEGNAKFRYKGNNVICAKIGETVKTDSAEITIHSITFSDVVDTKNLEPSSSGITPENKDIIYACFDFTVNSFCKIEKNLDDICVISMNYNDGFIFGENMAGHYAEKNSTGYRTYSSLGSSSGKALYISPLTSVEYRGCIECPILVSEDETSPLKFVIKLFSETNGYENVEIVVR